MASYDDVVEHDGRTLYRYRVTEIWGEPPEQISRLLGAEDGFLLYPEDRGDEFQQDFISAGEILGGWYCERPSLVAAKCP